MASPQRNRVTPEGQIVAIPLRGAWTGNRGIIHDGHTIRRQWASHHWLVCALQFKDWWHEQWRPGHLTWLFFHDEAVAFAAGHRPCALCRRADYNAFRGAWPGAERPPSHDDIDRTLHGQRLAPGSRRRRTHPTPWRALPDGAFVIERGGPALVHGGRIVAWTVSGYGTARRRPARGEADLLTPPATLAVLQTGYPVQIDASAGGA
jgi:hypothetical protein